MANTVASLSEFDAILNNNEPNNIYFSASASILLSAVLFLGYLFMTRYKYISLK